MFNAAIVLFLLAAVGGLVMAIRIFGGRQPPGFLAVGHGLLAATALILTLLIAVDSGAAPLVKDGAIVLVIAALGGFFLLSLHLRQKPHPKAVVILHALLAVAGVGCLVATLV